MLKFGARSKIAQLTLLEHVLIVVSFTPI